MRGTSDHITDFNPGMIHEFAQELAKSDPGQATNWLSENATGEVLDQALSGSVSLWLASDFEAATIYLKQIEDKSRD